MAFDNKEFPQGYNWQCPLCGRFASVAVADLDGYVCPKCKGRGLQAFRVTPKAVVVPEQKFKDTVLKFKDPRFMTGIKKNLTDSSASNPKKKTVTTGKKGGRKKR